MFCLWIKYHRLLSKTVKKNLLEFLYLFHRNIQFPLKALDRGRGFMFSHKSNKVSWLEMEMDTVQKYKRSHF